MSGMVPVKEQDNERHRKTAGDNSETGDRVIQVNKENRKAGITGLFSKGILNKTQEGLAAGFADLLAVAGAAEGAGLYDVMRGKNPFNSENAQIAARQRKAYNEVTKEYEAAHPYAALAAELIGGLPAAALPIGNIAKLKGAPKLLGSLASRVDKMGAIGKSAFAGSGFGALYGLGNAYTNSQDLTSAEAIKNALLGSFSGLAGGAVLGGAAGAVLPPIVNTIGKGVNAFTKAGRINIEPWLNKEIDIAAKEAGLLQGSKAYKNFSRDVADKYYKHVLQGEKIVNPGLDSNGMYSSIGRDKTRGVGIDSLDVLPYAPGIIEKGKIGRLKKNDGHANNHDFESFIEIITPARYKNKNVNAVALLGKLKENPQSPPRSNAVRSGGNNNIANNKKKSMPLWRFYTSYPKPYDIVSDTIYNANPEFVSRLLGSYAGRISARKANDKNSLLNKLLGSYAENIDQHKW